MSNESSPFSEAPVPPWSRSLIGRFRLKRTLLSVWLASIVLALILLGGLFDVVVSRLHENSARDKVAGGIAALSQELAFQRDSLLRDVDRLARRDDLVTILNFVATHSDDEAAGSFAIDMDKARIALHLNNETQLLEHGLISVHDPRSRPIAYAHKRLGADMDAGYLAVVGGETVVMALGHDSAEFPVPVALPYLLKELATQPAPSSGAAAAEFIALADGRIVIRATAPVRRVLPDGTVRVVGSVQAVHILEESFLKTLANRQPADIAFQVEGLSAIGADRKIAAADAHAAPALAPGARIPAFAWRAREDGYAGFARLSLQGGKSAVFAAHYGKETLQSTLASFRALILPVLIFAGLAVITLGTIFLNHVLFAPLGRLMNAAENLQAGRPMTLDPAGNPTEIADLARALDGMARTIREREDSLRQLNAELERRVEERSAALVHSQERYRDYVETASDWVWEMGPDLRFTYFSDRIRDIAGIDPKALVGRRRDEISATDDPENWHRHLDDLAARRPFRNFRYPLRRPDGTRVHISISGKPVFNQRGVFQGYRGVGTNVTAMVEVEQRMREAQRLAESANRTKSEFLANVSHELRTPLNAILGYSDVIRNRIFGPVENERYREYIEYIHESGVHLLQLINDVLDVSAIEAGKLELNESDCPIPALVEAAVRMIRTRAENKGLTLAIDLSAGLPALRADERRMKQILINLLSNAVKFTKAPATVRIEAGIAPNGDVWIAVADEGIGMTAEDVKKALQPFGRTRDGIAVADEGTGLGLPLARALTEAHGGILMMDSAPGRGTTVTLRFPSFRAVAPTDATLTT